MMLLLSDLLRFEVEGFHETMRVAQKAPYESYEVLNQLQFVGPEELASHKGGEPSEEAMKRQAM
jgi:hypothetical protein